MKIVVERGAAIERLQTNYTLYREEYKAQRAGWQHAVEMFVYALKEWSRLDPETRGEKPSEPWEPRDFAQDYRDLIEMLRFMAQDEVELDASDVNKIIHNRFSWHGEFVGNSATYTAAMA